jgi:hypothetical protein
LAAFKECLEALLKMQNIAPEERNLAKRDLEDMKNFGRISDDSLGNPQYQVVYSSLTSSADAAQSPMTIEKKKRVIYH